MTYTLEIYGASDDLIEVEGAIREEFDPSGDDDGTLLVCSNGTVLRITYTDAGIWRIVPVTTGYGSTVIDLAPEDDDDNYSDVATVTFDLAPVWVVCANRFEKAS